VTLGRLRAILIVSVLTVAAMVFVGLAISWDRQTHNAVAVGCAKGKVPVNLKLPDDTKDIKVNVYNASEEVGRAGEVADDLRGRKFNVGKIGNDPLGKQLDSVAVLRFGPSVVGAAWVVNAHLLNRATLEFDIKRNDDTVDVVIGTQFRKLATATEMRQALSQAGKAQLPSSNTCDARVK
jgi:hypothetical protein